MSECPNVSSTRILVHVAEVGFAKHSDSPPDTSKFPLTIFWGQCLLLANRQWREELHVNPGVGQFKACVPYSTISSSDTGPWFESHSKAFRVFADHTAGKDFVQRLTGPKFLRVLACGLRNAQWDTFPTQLRRCQVITPKHVCVCVFVCSPHKSSPLKSISFSGSYLCCGSGFVLLSLCTCVAIETQALAHQGSGNTARVNTSSNDC